MRKIPVILKFMSFLSPTDHHGGQPISVHNRHSYAIAVTTASDDVRPIVNSTVAAVSAQGVDLIGVITCQFPRRTLMSASM